MSEMRITKKMLSKLREGRDKRAREIDEQFIIETEEKENFLTKSRTLMKEAVEDNKKKTITNLQ